MFCFLLRSRAHEKPPWQGTSGGRIAGQEELERRPGWCNVCRHTKRDTSDEQVCAVISQRLKDKHDLFGGLPDAIDDDWIAVAEHLAQQADRYIRLRDRARTAFELRYQTAIDVDAQCWVPCGQVLSWRDIIERRARPW